jgi:hypothetical protein
VGSSPGPELKRTAARSAMGGKQTFEGSSEDQDPRSPKLTHLS